MARFEVELIEKGPDHWNLFFARKGRKPDLSGEFLRFVNLIQFDLSSGLFCRTKLEHCTLLKANMTGAELIEAQIISSGLQNVQFTSANLSDSRISSSDLSESDFSSASLNRCTFSFCVLSSAKFVGASLISTSFSGCNMSNSLFNGANLTASNLSSAFLNACDFSEANLSLADLSGSCGYDANFHGANLINAKLMSTDLSRARGLTQPQIESSRGDELTILPPTLEKPKGWMTDAGKNEHNSNDLVDYFKDNPWVRSFVENPVKYHEILSPCAQNILAGLTLVSDISGGNQLSDELYTMLGVADTLLKIAKSTERQENALLRDIVHLRERVRQLESELEALLRGDAETGYKGARRKFLEEFGEKSGGKLASLLFSWIPAGLLTGLTLIYGVDEIESLAALISDYTKFVK